LRAHDPTEFRSDLRPLATIFGGVSAASVEVHQDRTRAADARSIIVSVGSVRNLESLGLAERDAV
jgi:hypothetical protein